MPTHLLAALELTGEALALPGDAALTIITYTVAPHSASEQALGFLASWATQTAAHAGDTTSAASEAATGPSSGPTTGRGTGNETR
jgi:hypothetical protein